MPALEALRDRFSLCEKVASKLRLLVSRAEFRTSGGPSFRETGPQKSHALRMCHSGMK